MCKSFSSSVAEGHLGIIRPCIILLVHTKNITNTGSARFPAMCPGIEKKKLGEASFIYALVEKVQYSSCTVYQSVVLYLQ